MDDSTPNGAPTEPKSTPTPAVPAPPTIPILTTRPQAEPLAPEAFLSPRQSPGQLPADAYASTLSPWRAWIRARILTAVERESPVIAMLQAKVRHPWLDAYFVYTSSLGTHTFFMIALPMLFFFGFHELGRGLLFVLAFGVYFSSFVKDLVCSPRPFSPPVTRLTIGTHHLEYGFPSTHSTNSVSIALFVFSHVHAAYVSPESTMTPAGYAIACTVLAVYAFSIVLGRLYTAMHSVTDCVAGVALGTMVWAAYESLKPVLEMWLESRSWSVPLTTIPACLLLVHFHPQPVDDCPCFEDAIAFVSVILGGWLGRWHIAYAAIESAYLDAVMPGARAATWDARAVWWGVAGAKIGVGVLIIFAWRILAKLILHRLLPPLFRALAACVRLPHRRFYTPATDYARVAPAEGLRPIPSVIDLHALGEVDMDSAGVGASGIHGNGGRGASGNGKAALKRRNGLGPSPLGANGGANGEPRGEPREKDRRGKVGMMEKGGKDGPGVTHYDADVLTKVVVYAGIALLASEGIPVMFAVLGWGVKPY